MRPAAHGAREAAGGPGGVPRVTEALVLMVYLLIRASDDGRTNPPEVDPAEPFPQLLGVCEYAQPPARLAQLQHAGSLAAEGRASVGEREGVGPQAGQRGHRGG